jgi:ubiquinone biosynthesis protein UbiJ
MQANHLALFVCAAVELAFSKLPAKAQADYAKTKALHGKVLKIQLSQLPFPLYFIFASQLQVLSHYEGEVNVQLSVDLATLNQLREGASLTELIKQDKLSLEGDLQLLQSFSQFIKQVRFDFAEPLSRYIGDAPTHILTSTAKSAHQWALSIIDKTGDHLSQLATQEYRLAPHRREYQDLSFDIDALAQDAVKLAQKIQQLREKKRP